MMNTWNRRFVALGLFAALTLGTGCTSSESPVGPSAAAPTQAPELLLGGLGSTLGSTVSKVLSITDLLTCSSLPYATTTRTIGRDGGTVVVGQYSLKIPAGALKSNVQIRAEQMSGKVNSVRFSPEGLKFATPATLTMGYQNCALVLLPKRIVYTSELLKVLEVLRTLDLLGPKAVTAPIDHFSRYAVAY
jgi:hypothetical protein